MVPAGDEHAHLGVEFGDRAEGAVVDPLALMIPNHTSARFSHDPEVGVKCTWIRGFTANPVPDLDFRVGGVVVHYQVQLLTVAGVGGGPGNLFEDRPETRGGDVGV